MGGGGGGGGGGAAPTNHPPQGPPVRNDENRAWGGAGGGWGVGGWPPRPGGRGGLRRPPGGRGRGGGGGASISPSGDPHEGAQVARGGPGMVTTERPRGSATARAVSRARARSLAYTASMLSPERSSASARACAIPASFSGRSVCPWTRRSAFQSVSPCRVRRIVVTVLRLT